MMNNEIFDMSGRVFKGLSKMKQDIVAQAESGIAMYKQQQLIIRFNEGATETEIQSFLQEQNLRIEKRLIDSIYLVNSLLREPMTRTLIKVNSAPVVVYAEPNYLPVFYRIPTDAEFARQWSLRNTGQNGGTPGLDIDILSAWDVTKGSSDVIVAVIDSGFDPNQMEYRDRLLQGWNFLHNNNNTALAESDQFHGTAVVGVIAAAENGISIVGVAPKIKILPLIAGPADVVISSIQFAQQKGAKVVNMSFGYMAHIQSLKDVMEASPLFFASAAGNEGVNNDPLGRAPSTYNIDNQIATANIDNKGNLAPSSSFGVNTVSLAAPGEGILTTASRNMIITMSGTSFSSPMVAGVAALLYSIKPNLTAQEVKRIIVDNVTKLNSLNGKVTSGGFLNAGKAIQAALNIQPPVPPTIILDAPRNVRVIDPTLTSLTVVWEPPANPAYVLNYEIYRDDVKVATVPVGTHSFIDRNLPSHKIYSYTVRSHAFSVFSNSVTEKIESDIAPPPAPTNFRLLSSMDNCTAMTWNESTGTGITGYRIYRNNIQLAEIPPQQNVFIDKAAHSGQNCYKVTAMNANGESNASNEKCR